MHRYLGSAKTVASADKIDTLAAQLSHLRATAGAVPLQKILVEASAGILDLEKFNYHLEPLVVGLASATGVLTHLGGWIGGLVPSVLQTMGLDAGNLEDVDIAKVTDAIDSSREALSVDSVVPQNLDVDVFEDVSFDHLCFLLSQVERDVRKQAGVLPRDQVCPDADNGFLGQVRPDELQIPTFKSISLDFAPPLW